MLIISQHWESFAMTETIFHLMDVPLTAILSMGGSVNILDISHFLNVH